MTTPPASLPALLLAGQQQLLSAGVASPRVDVEILAAHVLGVPRANLATDRTLSTEESRALREAVDRRARREPLQHITGRAAFRHLELEVGPGVFIPRPETEVMAGEAVAFLAELVARGEAPLAVDLCAGSGAVALSLATEVPQAIVFAVEKSPEAAVYAERNAAGTGVEVRIADMADAGTELPQVVGRAHVVTANPPYIPLTAWESVEQEVRDHDPDIALWSGEDGLGAIRVVERVAAELLRDGGLVTCEHADVQGESAPAVFAGTGHWRDVRDHADLTGRPRFVTARRVRILDQATGTMVP